MTTKNKKIKRLAHYADQLEHNNHPERAQELRKNIARTNPHSNSRIIRELRNQFTAAELTLPPKKKELKQIPELEQKCSAPVLPSLLLNNASENNSEESKTTQSIQETAIKQTQEEKEEKSELSQAITVALGQAYLNLVTGIDNYDLEAHFISLGNFFLALSRKTNNQLKFQLEHGFYEALGKALINSKSKQPKNLQIYYGLVDPNPDAGTVGLSFTIFAARCDELFRASTIATVTARTLDRFIDYFKTAKPNEPIYIDSIKGETPEMREIRMMLEISSETKAYTLPMFSKSYIMRYGPRFSADQLKQFNEYHKTIPTPSDLPANVIAQLSARNYDAAAKLIIHNPNSTAEQIKSLGTYLLKVLTKFDELDNKITNSNDNEQHSGINMKL